MGAERVLLVRSGRHLTIAIGALRERFPECEIAVVGTPGSEPVIAQAGIWPDRTFIYGARPRFTPLAFACSRASLQARSWRFTRVAVLWNDPDGRGQGNVDRTAFTLAPGGFLAVTPDGSIVERAPFPMLRYEVRRARASLRVGAMLAALYVAAIAIGLVRHTIGWLKWPALPARAGRLRKPGTGTRRRVVVTARRWPPAAAGRSRTSNDEAA